MRLELASIGLAGKDSTRQDIPAQAVTGTETLVPEGLTDLEEGWLTGLGQLAGDHVSIDDPTAELGQNRTGGGFTHANPAGQPVDFHAESADISMGRKPRSQKLAGRFSCARHRWPGFPAINIRAGRTQRR